MTDIDPKSDIDLKRANEHVIVRVPLAGLVTEEWLRCYERLAHASGVPVQAEADPDRAWIVVNVPASGNHKEIAATMDAARGLLAETDAAARAPGTVEAEGIVRDWWTSRRESVSRRPVAKIAVVRTGLGVEKRWPLVTDLVEGGPETNSATELLSVGFGVWLYTILAFAFLYWIVDGGGPDARLWAPPEYPHLAFPEQLAPDVAPPGWRPQFFDYLYLAFTNATAFSPTDVMPLARWAKAAMTLQAAGSLAILGLVIARAVNILQ